MNTKKYQLENYRKFLLNRVTASTQIVEYIENCLGNEDESINHSFHKIMVHNWTENPVLLLDTLSEYFTSVFVPVDYSSQGDITTFYTSSLTLILKIIKFDFMFPFQRNMVNIDVLFNDKNSTDFFENRITIEEIVSGVVSRRLNDKFELDLSNFCNDPEFVQKNINFYKFSLLSHYKILMLRIGRDTKILNLSSNKLSTVPLDILNFFIKGDLTEINLSDNKIPSLQELHRVSSKIEKLWLEGNPLCDDIDAVTYVKQIVMKFPRLIELDGIKLNKHGIIFPFYKNYLDTPDRRTKMLVEKFLTLYFTHYDARKRRKISAFYDTKAKLSISTNFTAQEEKMLPQYSQYSRNALDPDKRKFVYAGGRLFNGRGPISLVLLQLPQTVHDPSTFTVDVVKQDKKTMTLIVDGVYRENHPGHNPPELFFSFRRTFIFNIYPLNSISTYHIIREMFTVSFAPIEQIDNSFKLPIRNMNSLALTNPEPEEIDSIVQAFSHITQLKTTEAESRLKIHNWDILLALRQFNEEFKNNKISPDKFIEEDDDLSDLSSVLDDID